MATLVLTNYTNVLVYRHILTNILLLQEDIFLFFVYIIHALYPI